MELHVHTHWPRKVRDAFEESKHPRADDGKFGAGAGKSHAEHRAHHAGQSEKHEANAAASQGEERQGHASAAGAHAVAAIRHGVAEKSGGEHSARAHAASKSAHEASQKANGEKSDKGPVPVAEAKAHPFVHSFLAEHTSIGKQEKYLQSVPDEKLKTAHKLIGNSIDLGSSHVKKLLEAEGKRRGIKL